MHFKTTLIALGCAIALTGCIHKDYPPCKALEVKLIVGDKNYSNVDIIEEEDPIDESRAFHEYVPTMCYVLRNAETGEVVNSSGIEETTRSEADHVITFPENLPHGKYDLIVWGGIKDLKALEFDNDPSTAAFHTSDDEDIYLGHATIDYNPQDTDKDLIMRRTMGKLIVIKELVGRAEGVNRTQKVISNVCHHVNLDANYEGTTDVVFENTFTPAPRVVTKTVVAPTAGDQNRFHIEFFNDTPDSHFPVLIPDDVNVNIRPNEITVLRYVYNPEIEKFEIYVKKDSDWETVYYFNLED